MDVLEELRGANYLKVRSYFSRCESPVFIVMAGLPQRGSLRLSYSPIFTSPLTPLAINVLFILQTVSNCIASPISSRHSLWGRIDQFVHSLRARSDGRLNRLILTRNYSSDNYHAQEMLALAFVLTVALILPHGRSPVLCSF